VSDQFKVVTYLGGGPLLAVLGVLSKITNTTTTTILYSTRLYKVHCWRGVSDFSDPPLTCAYARFKFGRGGAKRESVVSQSVAFEN
jgi:hypothetical protein